MKTTSLYSVAVIAIGMLILNGCSPKSHLANLQPNMIEFQKGDYTLSDIKTAESEVTILFGFWRTGENDKWADLAVYGEGNIVVPNGCPAMGCVGGGLLGSALGSANPFDPVYQAKSAALYNLMDANPGYDGVLAPNYKVEVSYPCFLPNIITKAKCTVNCRMVKFNK